jgi:hypothetical protein
LLRTVACIDKDGNPGKQAGNNPVMMDEMIMEVKDIGAIDSQLPGDFEGSRGVDSGGLFKRTDRYPQTFCFRSQSTGMGEAVDCGFMTVLALTLREVKYQPFQATHIEIVDELNDAHFV